MAALSLGAFGIGGFVSGHTDSLAGPPVSALSAFQADAGVPAAANNLDTANAILRALRERIAIEYAWFSAGVGNGTGAPNPTIVQLQTAADKVVLQESRAQVALADATDHADIDRLRQLSRHRWKEVLIRVIASAISYLLLAGITAAVAAWAKIPVKLGPVLGCAATLLFAFLAADIVAWVAGLVLLLFVVTFLIRDRSR